MSELEKLKRERDKLRNKNKKEIEIRELKADIRKEKNPTLYKAFSCFKEGTMKIGESTLKATEYVGKKLIPQAPTKKSKKKLKPISLDDLL